MGTILDEAVLSRLQDAVGEDNITMLVEVFLQETPPLIATLKTALAEEDAAIAERTAHSLKSSAANFGLMALSELNKKIEMAAREKNLPEAKSLSETLEDDAIKAVDTLKSHLSLE